MNLNELWTWFLETTAAVIIPVWNDLIQYLLAADRGNPSVRDYYDALHPAVLQAVASMVDVCKRHDRELCLCGEMASDAACLAVLQRWRALQ